MAHEDVAEALTSPAQLCESWWRLLKPEAITYDSSYSGVLSLAHSTIRTKQPVSGQLSLDAEKELLAA